MERLSTVLELEEYLARIMHNVKEEKEGRQTKKMLIELETCGQKRR